MKSWPKKGSSRFLTLKAIEKAIDQVLIAHPKQVADYRGREPKNIWLSRWSNHESDSGQGQPAKGE